MSTLTRSLHCNPNLTRDQPVQVCHSSLHSNPDRFYQVFAAVAKSLPVNRQNTKYRALLWCCFWVQCRKSVWHLSSSKRLQSTVICKCTASLAGDIRLKRTRTAGKRAYLQEGVADTGNVVLRRVASHDQVLQHAHQLRNHLHQRNKPQFSNAHEQNVLTGSAVGSRMQWIH